MMVIVNYHHTLDSCYIAVKMMSSTSPIGTTTTQKTEFYYSQVPIKQVGPNKRVGWVFYVDLLNK